MAAAEKQDDWWVDLQRRREERMRYEVLVMLYEAVGRCVDFPVDVSGFVRRLGVWEDELRRVLQYLGDRGYIRYLAEGSEVSVCLSVKGVDYIEKDARRRKSIRDDPS
jgi:hypothetical protein